MIKVKMLDTGKIKEVTRNVAHGLVERGKAVLAGSEEEKELKPKRGKKRYKTK